jgi:hypothetical protein
VEEVEVVHYFGVEEEDYLFSLQIVVLPSCGGHVSMAATAAATGNATKQALRLWKRIV